MIDLPALRRLLQDATPRPWHAPQAGNREWLYEDSVLTSGTSPRIGTEQPGRVLAKMNTNFEYRADLDLITTAVNSLEPLLAVYEAACEVERSQTENPNRLPSNAALTELRAAIDRARQGDKP